MVTRKDLEDLPLAERISKLRDMEKKAEKEIAEAKQLRSEIEEEIARERTIEGIEVPRSEPVDVAKLFFSSEGLEAKAVLEQEADKDFQAEYLSVLEGGELSAPDDLYVTSVINIIDKLDDLLDGIKYHLPQDKMSGATASASVADRIRRYTRG
ncbi:MAG: hypothetical protein ABIC95_04115 [archaeon]